MTLLQAMILGIVQGLTEFLPISSSAHLVLTPYLLGWEIPPEEAFVFDVLVQMGTLVAVGLYFRQDFWRIGQAWVKDLLAKKPFEHPESRLGWLILVATIPAGIFGLLVKDQVEAAFNDPLATGILLLGTALILIVSERIGKRTRNLDQLSWQDALWIGAFQALAVFPGISRSGSSIAGGLTRNLERISAARFAFLISIPIMLAAGGLAILDLAQVSNLSEYLWIVSVGFITSAVTGYLSIRWLLQFLNRNSLLYFAVYCTCLGITVVLFTLFT
jgi:undecaprenyl-diphosphatase